MFRLFPPPKECSFYEGFLSLSHTVSVTICPQLKASCQEAGYVPESALSELFSGLPENYTLQVTVEYADYHPEGFRLSIDGTGIHIACNTGAGLFYAIQALSQLTKQGGGLLPFSDIFDEPMLTVRGIMLDIGRDKIPAMETFYRLIDLFAAMRLNHLQLYMEGYCFDYEDFRYLFTNETPVTPQEYKALSDYAKARFIDLVPNQNVLGHMEQWLAKPQFSHLAECEDGYIFENLYRRPPMTLDVRNKGSFELACTLLSALLKNSSSGYINVNMDEPFELGMGKNKEAAERSGRLCLYFEYLEKLNEFCKSKGKKMLMWGDEVLHHPDYVSRFPKDVTLLDWLYEGDASFESHAGMMQATGLNYCLCPGTSSWGSLTGRSDNMAKNIRDAASCAIRYGGLGIITTDWGDLGHWQYISASFPGFAHTAFCSWSGPDSDFSAIPWYCNRFIYESPDESAYKAAWDLGNYYHYEHAPLYNTTLAFAVMSSKYAFDSVEEFDAKMERLLTLSANIAKTNNIPPRKPEINTDFPAMNDYLEKVDTEIKTASLCCADSERIKEEMTNGLRMIRHGIHLYHTMKVLRDNKPAFRREMKVLFEDLDEILKVHYRLWMSRNRCGGFQRSTEHMNRLLAFYRRMMKS